MKRNREEFEMNSIPSIDISDMYEEESEESIPKVFPYESNPENILSLFFKNLNKQKFIFTKYFTKDFRFTKDGTEQENPEKSLKQIFHDKKSFFFNQNNIYNKQVDKVFHEGRIQQFENVNFQLIKIYEISDTLVLENGEWKIEFISLTTVFKDLEGWQRKIL
jgi:hypothetical protein